MEKFFGASKKAKRPLLGVYNQELNLSVRRRPWPEKVSQICLFEEN